MANQDQLQGLLGQLADENHIERNLPFVLESISHNRYLDDESSDLSKFHKWITRLNSLLHSKNSTARWASISLIKATCEQSSALYHANVASWVLNILNILTVCRFFLSHSFQIRTLYLTQLSISDLNQLRYTKLPSEHWTCCSRKQWINQRCNEKSLLQTYPSSITHCWIWVEIEIFW